MEALTGNKISIDEARRFLITYQGLNHNSNSQDENSVLEFVRKVGCIQFDPLNIVGRNPDLVLQSRIKNYNSSILNDLLYEKRSLIDGWDKMMAIYLQTDWPYFSRVRKENGKDLQKVLAHRNASQALDYLEQVKNIVIESGPLQSNKIDIGSNNPGSWGHRKLSSAALVPEMYRGGKELHIKAWWWEEDIIVTEELETALKQAFEQFCNYIGAENVNKEDFENKCLCYNKKS